MSATAAAIASAALFICPAQQVLAQAFPTWQGTGTNWSDAANWDEAYAYGQLEWQGAGNATSFNNLSSPQSQWRFFFNGSQAYTLSGADVHFFDFGGTNGGILGQSTVLQTINNNLSFRDNGARSMGIVTTAAGGLTFNGQIELTNSMTFLGIGSSSSSSLLTFNGAIVGNKGVVIGTNGLQGSSSGFTATRAVFNGSNSYTGTTEIRRGTLAITNGNSLSTNQVILGLGGAVGLIDAGLQVNGSTTAGNTFSFENTTTNVTLNVTNGVAFTITGALINSTGANASTKFAKAGAGTLILANAASTYAGQVQIGDGAVVIGQSAALGTNITTATRGIDLGLNLRDVSQANNVSLLLSNGVTLSNSIYVAPNTSSASRTLGIAGSGSATVNNQIYLDGNLTTDVASGNTLTLAGNLTNTGGIIKIGTGTLILSALNTNSGALDISNGVVLVTATRGVSQNSTGNTVRSGAALEVSNNVTLVSDSLTVNGSGIASNGAIRSIGGSNQFNRGIILGSSTRLQADTGASLTISNFTAGSNAVSGTGFNLTVSGDGNTRITGTGGTNVIMTGVGGSLTKLGAGTLALVGSNNYTGITTVSGGALEHFAGQANSILSSEIMINGGRFRLVGGGSDNNIAGTANLTISSGEFTQDQFRSQNLTQLNMSGGTLTRTDDGIWQFGGAASVTGGAINVTGTNGVVRFNSTLALGGANVVYSNALSGTTNNVRITGDVTYSATNTTAAWFTNAAAGVGQLQLNAATNTFNIADSGSVASEVNINWTVVGSALRKTGTGVLTLGGTTANTYSGNTVVEGGTLALNKTAGVTAVAGNVEVSTGGTLLISAGNQVADTSTVTLSGGSILRGAGVSEAFGDLNVTSASNIDFGGTAESRFLQFGAVTGGSNLSVANFLLNNQFRFAAADFAAGETIANSFTFLTSDFRSYSFASGTFTITAVPEPSTVLAAIGLSGLMLWGPVRRRLQRSRK